MTDTDMERASLTVDVALFGEHEGQLNVLVIQRGWPPYEGCWALPGGHVDAGEDVLAAAHRELGEETGLSVQSLDRVGVYADPGRDPRGRVVSFAYTARIPSPLPQPTAGDDAAEARWLPVHELLAGQQLAFDHGQIIHDALRLTASVSVGRERALETVLTAARAVAGRIDGRFLLRDLTPVLDELGRSRAWLRAAIRSLVEQGALERVDGEPGTYRIAERAS